MRASNRILALVTAVLAFGSAAHAQPSPPQAEPRSRVLLISDIGNEPDDSESFVRFLLYANEFDVEGIIASTSTHQREKVQPQLFRERIAAYAKVLSNLRRHAPGYPDAERLQALVRAGVAQYGMSGVGDGKDTDASRLIVEAVDRADARPLWIPVWGGAADLAQALWTVRATRTPQQVEAFVAKLRVYSISDQDDAGPWIRRNFPQIFWIASIHGWNQYRMAAWTGISGDLNEPEKWPAAEMVTNAWLERNIRLGPLGTLYPPHVYIMEGDTPSLLYLIPNGLNVPEHPEWGGWGGRYVKSDLSAGHYGDAADAFTAGDGKIFTSNQATIFRWRDAFQRDFAARMRWTVADSPSNANHSPVAVLNGVAGRSPVKIVARAGESVRLSARGSSDPDGQPLSYRWLYYREPAGGFFPPSVTLDASGDQEASFVVPKVDGPIELHVILEVTDTGTPSMTTYRRALVSVAGGAR